MPKSLRVIALLFACNEGTPIDGQATGPCIAGECFGELVCYADACIPPVVDSDEGGLPSTSGHGEVGSTTSSSTSGPESTAEASTADPIGTSDQCTSGPSGGATSSSFIGETGGAAIECSIWLQDCPDGEKCNAYVGEDGYWDGTACFEVVDDPKSIGEACGTTCDVAGADDCGHGAICFGGDIEGNGGHCVAYCTGSEDAPECAAGTSCVITNEGVLALCQPPCDPFAQDCPDGQGCYPVDGAFVCAVDASGADGGHLDPCSFINACDPGFICGDPGTVPDCNASGCCSPFCEVTSPDCPIGLDCVVLAGDVGYCGIE